MKKVTRNGGKNLLNQAIKLAGKGYSVIPLVGDTSAGEPKKPTIKWRSFQRRIPKRRELEAMFDDRAGALAVICGQVSQLLVIDFDDHHRYQRFCRHLPQFAESYTVKTKRGFHVYFWTQVKVPTHQFDGGDIKGEKSYVVAAGSRIAGFAYKVVRRIKRMILDSDAVETLLNYFHVRRPIVNASEDVNLGFSDVDLVSLYDRLSVSSGRNNALYRCAAVGMRQGMDRVAIENALLRRHAINAGKLGHKIESIAERFAEGRRTIVSAFRRGWQDQGQGEGIANSVRERLLQAQGSSVTARLLDIMYMSGWQAESYFYMRDAIELCKTYGMNRKSVIAALTGEHCSFNGRHIISRRYVEYLDIEGLNSGRRGRPVQLLFQVPSISRLLNVLNVSRTPSDRLSKADLSSSHAYRRALHREYVKRLSPQAPMSVLASRLGLNARTLRRYNAQLGVQVCERIGRFTLSWETLKSLPRRQRDGARNQTPGYWLALGEGARFPAWRHIGAALLRRGGEAVQVCVRRASVMSLGKSNARSVVYESLSVESFIGLRILREGGVVEGGVLSRLRGLADRASARLVRARYEKLPLQYDTVPIHIAEDKIAETIRGYLFAEDGLGGEVRRPARRGVAYRMLKQYGEGNVYLALRDSLSEMMSAMAQHALRLGDEGAGMGALVRSMA